MAPLLLYDGDACLTEGFGDVAETSPLNVRSLVVMTGTSQLPHPPHPPRRTHPALQTVEVNLVGRHQERRFRQALPSRLHRVPIARPSARCNRTLDLLYN